MCSCGLIHVQSSPNRFQYNVRVKLPKTIFLLYICLLPFIFCKPEDVAAVTVPLDTTTNRSSFRPLPCRSEGGGDRISSTSLRFVWSPSSPRTDFSSSVHRHRMFMSHQHQKGCMRGFGRWMIIYIYRRGLSNTPCERSFVSSWLITSLLKKRKQSSSNSKKKRSEEGEGRLHVASFVKSGRE